jgi:hypothetical protein
VTLRFDHCISS